MLSLYDAVTSVEAGDEDHAQAVHVTGSGASTFVLNLRGWDEAIININIFYLSRPM